MTIVLKRKINYHLLQTYLPSGMRTPIDDMWPSVVFPVCRIVCNCLLVVPLPSAWVYPRQDWDGHDHAAHPGRHVWGCQTEHTQGQLCLCSGRLDVQLHCFCLLHSSRVCHHSEVTPSQVRMDIIKLLSLMYRRVKPDEEIRSSDNGSSSIGIQTGGDKNGSDDMDNHTVRVEEGISARRSRPRCLKHSFFHSWMKLVNLLFQILSNDAEESHSTMSTKRDKECQLHSRVKWKYNSHCTAQHHYFKLRKLNDN